MPIYRATGARTTKGWRLRVMRGLHATTRRGPGRARGRERGATLVEAALVLPVIITLLLGIVDFGWAFNDYISLRQGTREAARQAVVNTTPQPSSGTWNCPIVGNASVSGTSSNPAYVDLYDLMCYAKDRIGLTPQSSVRISLYWDQGSAGPPVTPPYSSNTNVGSPDAVVVCTQYPLTSITGVFSPLLNGTVITSKTEIRIEQTSTHISTANPPITPPVQETSLSSWPASCSAE